MTDLDPIADYESADSVKAKLNTTISDVNAFRSKSVTQATATALAFSDFGCRGDGSTDSADMTAETTAYQSAITWAAGHDGRVLLGDLDATYALNGTITGSGSCRILYRGARTRWYADVDGLRLSCTEGEVKTLGADYVTGALAIDLTGSPLSVAPAEGQVGVIMSNAADPANRDRGSASEQYRVAEHFIVGAGSSTTNIVLERSLEFVSGIDPTSTAGEEGVVASYTTAMAARVAILPQEHLDIRDADFGYQEGQENIPWNTAKVCTYRGYASSYLENVRCNRSYDAQINPVGTYGAVIVAPRCLRGENDTANGQLGYGINDGGSGTTVLGLIGHNCRHVYTTNNGSVSASPTDFFDVIRTPRNVGGTVVGGLATGGANGPWDTHASSEGTSFSGVTAQGCLTYGLTIRGRRVVASDVRIRNGLYGAQVFTEFSSGQTDDDLYNNAKTADAFTSASLSDLDIECDEDPLALLHATAEVGGICTYRTQDHCLTQVKGTATLSGTHRMVSSAGGVSHSRTGCLTVEDVNTNAAEAFPANSLLTIEEGAYVEIDARNAAAGTVEAFSVEANSAIVVRGTLKILLPAGATLGDTARVTCEGSGNILISVESAADDTLVTNSDDLTGLVIEGIDGSFWWRDPADTNARHRDAFLTFVDGAVGVSHTGTTAQTDNVYTPSGQYAIKAMNADGAGMVKMRLTGRKIGSAGTATLRLETDSNDFLDSAVLPAATNLWQIEATLIVSATNVQRFTGVCTSQDNSGGTFDVEVMRSDETQAYPAATTYAFSLGVTLGDAADTIEVETCEIWATRGGLL